MDDETYNGVKKQVGIAFRKNNFAEVLKLRENIPNEFGLLVTGFARNSTDNTSNYTPYLFAEYWCLTEPCSEAHNLAAALLYGSYAFIDGAYTLAFWHEAKALSFEPDNLAFLNTITWLGTTPDCGVALAEVVPYAKRMLSFDPEHNWSKTIVEWFDESTRS
ncbi:hypothetical protein [Lacticaseibacillus absianus]|uniref:hypothetical protein n=1 Tax=Lacticaseibacillus absianus TaxID=2729623 RepID=UPI0015C7F68F|nr:hypothetical protein [Lacticaseibacillus absianus]